MLDRLVDKLYCVKYINLFMYMHIYTKICAHLRYRDGTTLGTPAGMLVCRTATQRDPGRLGERANRILMKFSQGEGRVLHV